MNLEITNFSAMPKLFCYNDFFCYTMMTSALTELLCLNILKSDEKRTGTLHLCNFWRNPCVAHKLDFFSTVMLLNNFFCDNLSSVYHDKNGQIINSTVNLEITNFSAIPKLFCYNDSFCHAIMTSVLTTLLWNLPSLLKSWRGIS